MVQQVQFDPSKQLVPSASDALPYFGANAHPSPAVPSATGSPAGTEDEVTLSVTAQARQMIHSGETVDNIAASLGTTPAMIDSDLGIKAPTSPAGLLSTIAKIA